MRTSKKAPLQMNKEMWNQNERRDYCSLPRAVNATMTRIITKGQTRMTGLPFDGGCCHHHHHAVAIFKESDRANKSSSSSLSLEQQNDAADKQDGILPNKNGLPGKCEVEMKVQQEPKVRTVDYRKYAANTAAIDHLHGGGSKKQRKQMKIGHGGLLARMMSMLLPAIPKRIHVCGWWWWWLWWIFAASSMAICFGTGMAISETDFRATNTTTATKTSIKADTVTATTTATMRNQTKIQSATISTSTSLSPSLLASSVSTSSSLASTSASTSTSTSTSASALLPASTIEMLPMQRQMSLLVAKPSMSTASRSFNVRATPAGDTATPTATTTATTTTATSRSPMMTSTTKAAAAVSLIEPKVEQQMHQQHHQLEQEIPGASLSVASPWHAAAATHMPPPASLATAATSLIVAIVTSGSVIRARNTHTLDNRSETGSHENDNNAIRSSDGGGSDIERTNLDLSEEEGMNSTMLMDHKAFADTLLKGFMIPTFLPPFPAFAMADLPLYTTAAPPPSTTTQSSQEQYSWSGGGDTHQDQLYLAAYNRQRHNHRQRGGGGATNAGGMQLTDGDDDDDDENDTGGGLHHHPHHPHNRLVVSSSNVSVQLGSHAYLPCHIRRLTNKPISWIRVRDGHILSVDQTTFIADQRFQSIYNENDEFSWSLQIKYVQLIDKGWYECQVSSEPKMSAKVFLTVVVPVTELIGDQTRYVKEGSKVVLYCTVRGTIEPPAYIVWHRGATQIDDNNKMGWFTQTNRNIFGKNQSDSQDTIGSLVIPFVRKMDSGNYTCQPSNAAGVSVDLHVLSGEYSASAIMSTASLPNTCQCGILQRLLSSCSAVFVLLIAMRWHVGGGT